MKKIVSFLMSVVLVLSFVAPSYAISIVNNDKNYPIIEFYNDERVLMKINGFIFTSSLENGIEVIKSYNSNGELSEEVKVLNTQNGILSTTYDENKKMLTEEMILVDGSRSQFYESSIVQRSADIFLGRTTYSSTISPYYRAMTVSYNLETLGGQTYRVPNNIDTIARLIGFLINVASWSNPVVSKVVDSFIIQGVVVPLGEKIINNFYEVAVNESRLLYKGLDTYNNQYYSGSISGSRYTVITQGSKYFNQSFYEGVFIGLEEWGNGRISNALAPSVYGPFLSYLTYKGEAR